VPFAILVGFAQGTAVCAIDEGPNSRFVGAQRQHMKSRADRIDRERRTSDQLRRHLP